MNMAMFMKISTENGDLNHSYVQLPEGNLLRTGCLTRKKRNFLPGQFPSVELHMTCLFRCDLVFPTSPELNSKATTTEKNHQI